MRGLKNRWIALLLIVSIVSMFASMLTGCSQNNVIESKEKLNQYRDMYYDYFDTVSIIVGYEEEEEVFQKNCEFIESELKRYHELYDIYHSYEGITNIYDLNKKAAESPVEVDQDVIALLKFGKEMYEQTEGYTNIAFGAVLSIWHSYRQQGSDDPVNAQLPPMEELQEASEHCSIDDLIIDEENSTVFFADPKLKLDVGAIAKGYATERICQSLLKQGVDHYALNIGGNVRSLGTKADGTAWVAGIQNPDTSSSQTYVLQVGVAGKALVTSGSYQRYYYVGDQKYHHIIHPETLMPVNRFQSVSILNEDSGMGDALSTALFNMSLEEGLTLVNSLHDTEAMWIDEEGQMHYSDGFDAFVVE